MITIIAGSRTLRDPDLVPQAVQESGFTVTTVVSGHAPGVDRNGERWAQSQNVPVRVFIAEWDQEGRAAGKLRNERMVNWVRSQCGTNGQLIAIHDGISKGTAHVIRYAREQGLRVYVKPVFL